LVNFEKLNLEDALAITSLLLALLRNIQ
jgi:hypothetical protein